MFKRTRKIWTVYLEGPAWIRLPRFLERKPLFRRPPSLMLLIWLQALYDRILSVQGRMLLAVFVVVAFYCSLMMRSPALAIFFTLLAVFLTDWILGFIFKPNVEGIRELPERVRCGSIFRIRYTIRNKRRLPCWNLQCDFRLNSKELERIDPPIHLQLPGRTTRILDVRARANERGSYRLPRPLFDSSFPFNIFRHAKTSGEPGRLIVHPVYYTFDDIRTFCISKLQRQSMNSLPRPGQSMDFQGCREYRIGDTPKKIHWRASAKFGTFIVKEFQEEHASRAAIILDNLLVRKRPRGNFLKRILHVMTRDLHEKNRCFEGAVSLCASLAATLTDQDFVIDIFAAGANIHRFKAGKDFTNLTGILDILATLETDRKEPFDRIAPKLTEEIASIGLVFLILLRSDKKAERFHEELLRSGTQVLCFIVDDDSGNPCPPWAIPLPPETILNGSFSIR